MSHHRRRSWWGWGFEDGKLDAATLAPLVRDVLGFPLSGEVEAPVELSSISLPAPRFGRPAGIPGWSTDPRDRVEHAYGRSFPDTVRAFRGQVDHPPDAVVFASGEDDVEATLEWAAREDVAVIPFGGGWIASWRSIRCRARRGSRRAWRARRWRRSWPSTG